MASADSHSDPAEKKCYELAYTLQDMQRLQARFAEEAISFLSKNANIFKTFPAEFQTRHKEPGCSGTFTHDVGKAIITIGYIQRISYRKQFRKDVRHIPNAEAFSQYIMKWPIPKTESYFFYFLAWVAFNFDFMVYCLKYGSNFVEESIRCLASYADLEYFHSRGGWGQLLEFSNMMAKLYDRMKTVISREMPTDDRLLPFMKAIELIEKEERQKRNKWILAQPELRHLRGARRELMKKYDVISTLDPGRITTGYKVRMKASPEKDKPREELHQGAVDLMESLAVERGPEQGMIDDLAEQLEMTRIAAELTDRSRQSEDEYESKRKEEIERDGGTDETKSVFIVNKRFLERVKNNAKLPPQSKKKSCLKLNSPKKQTKKMAVKLNDVLDSNIAKENYSKVSDDVYAVCPPGCSMKDGASQYIVVNSSSEDESDGFNKDVRNRMQEALGVAWRECMNRKNKYVKVMLEEFAEKVVSGAEQVASGASASRPSEEYKSPPKYTGAIPKIKVHVPPTETKDLQETVRSEDLDSSNKPDVTLPQQSPKKKYRRKKKSKK